MWYSRLMWLSAIRDLPLMHAGSPPRNALPLGTNAECAAKFRLHLSDSWDELSGSGRGFVD
jgi:hypothetical protein